MIPRRISNIRASNAYGSIYGLLLFEVEDIFLNRRAKGDFKVCMKFDLVVFT